LQAKLLRVVQEREFERVGGTRTLPVDVRIVAATNRDLAAEVAARRFREDLYYRVNVVGLRVPPLRERAEDVAALLDHFLRRFALDAGRQALRFSPAAREALAAYGWPGNVRELANVVERAVALCATDEIGVEDLPEELVSSRAPSTVEPAAASAPIAFHDAVAAAKRAIIRDALDRTGGHQTRAAAELGLTQPYLARLIKNLGVRDV
jgi:DNA-binding NtrC family response regulator